MRPCLVFGGDPSDEDAIDDENGEDEDEDDGDGNQCRHQSLGRHIAMILWPGYYDTEVGFTQHYSLSTHHYIMKDK